MSTIIADIGQDFDITAASTYVLTNPGHKLVGTIAVHLQSASFSGSITVKASVKPQYPDNNAPTALTPVAWGYLSYYLNAAATSGISTAAITDTSLILVPASGLQIELDCTSFSSGTMHVRWEPVAGAAA